MAVKRDLHDFFASTAACAMKTILKPPAPFQRRKCMV
jgi:hypothetical protein